LNNGIGANLKRILELNRAQEISGHDTFTPGHYLRSLDHFDAHARDVLYLGCNSGRGEAVMKTRTAHLRITGIDCVPKKVASLDRRRYETGVCCFAVRSLLRAIASMSSSLASVVSTCSRVTYFLCYTSAGVYCVYGEACS